METRKLGRTGLEVSLLTFGCGAVGGLMTKGEAADQMRAVRAALDLGVNFFDTAPTYGNTASETNLGRILTELKPDIVLGTKVRCLPEEKDSIEAATTASMLSFSPGRNRTLVPSTMSGLSSVRIRPRLVSEAVLP